MDNPYDLDNNPYDLDNEPEQTPFANTLKSTGAHLLNSALGQPVEDVGQLTNSPVIQGLGRGVREYAEGVQQNNPTNINSVTDVLEHPWDATKVALGNVLPQIPASLASSFAGAKIGASLPLPPQGKLAAGALGSAVGLFAPSYLQAFTEMRGKQHQSGKEDIGKAALTAIPAALMETAVDRFQLGKLVPNGLTGDVLEEGASRIAHIAKQGVKGGASELPTEYIQTGLEQLGGNEDLTTDAAASERNLGAVLGGIGGTAVRGGISAFDGRVPVNDAPQGPLSKAVQSSSYVDQLSPDIQAKPETDNQSIPDTVAPISGAVTTQDAPVNPPQENNAPINTDIPVNNQPPDAAQQDAIPPGTLSAQDAEPETMDFGRAQPAEEYFAERQTELDALEQTALSKHQKVLVKRDRLRLNRGDKLPPLSERYNNLKKDPLIKSLTLEQYAQVNDAINQKRQLPYARDSDRDSRLSNVQFKDSSSSGNRSNIDDQSINSSVAETPEDNTGQSRADEGSNSQPVGRNNAIDDGQPDIESPESVQGKAGTNTQGQLSGKVAFTPTHTESSGEPVQSLGNGDYVDAQGIYSDQNDTFTPIVNQNSEGFYAEKETKKTVETGQETAGLGGESISADTTGRAGYDRSVSNDGGGLSESGGTQRTTDSSNNNSLSGETTLNEQKKTQAEEATVTAQSEQVLGDPVQQSGAFINNEQTEIVNKVNNEAAETQPVSPDGTAVDGAIQATDGVSTEPSAVSAPDKGQGNNDGDATDGLSDPKKADERHTSTSKSVRDNNQQAVIKDNVITVINRSGRKTVKKVTISLSDWEKAVNGYGNPNAHKRRLIENLDTVVMGIGANSPESQAVKERIIDSQITAINSAYEKLITQQDRIDSEPANKSETKDYQPSTKDKSLGKNEDGLGIFEDSKGKRYLQHTSGLQEYESIRMEPTPNGVKTIINDRNDKFLTDDELKTKSAQTQVPTDSNVDDAPVDAAKNEEITDQFADNKIFTADVVAKARARLKNKLGTLNSGFDPELAMDGLIIAGAYIESGVREFGAFSKAVLSDIGDGAKPYLRSWYEAARHYPDLDTKGMTDAAHIELMTKYNVYDGDKFLINSVPYEVLYVLDNSLALTSSGHKDIHIEGLSRIAEFIKNTTRIKQESLQEDNSDQPVNQGNSEPTDSTPISSKKEGARFKLAKAIYNELSTGEKITTRFLTKQANIAFGGTQANGAYTSKDAYDAMEVAVNMYLLNDKANKKITSASAKTTESKVVQLNDLIKRLPTQTKRDAEMDEFQQFSTPPALSMVANWVANVSEKDTMLEPSAGTGDLAIWSEIVGADIVLNELSERRQELLTDLFPNARLFKENAEQLNNVLPKDVVPTVIVMNPPFSSTAGRVQGQRKTSNGGTHIEQALKRLQKGGRLVAIVGNGMAADKPSFKKWWKGIESQYTVKANIGISGKEYAKYGTTFDNQILVIDKTGSTTEPIITGNVESVKDLPYLLEGIRNERSPAKGIPKVQPPSAQQESREDTQDGKDTVQPEVQTGSVSSNQGGDGQGNTSGLAQSGRGGGRGVVHSSTGGESGGSDAVNDGDRNRGSGRRTLSDGTGRSGSRDIGSDNQRDTVGSQNKVELERKKKKKSVFTESIFSDYEPQKLAIKGAKAHPGSLVQSSAMAAVEPPDPTYTPNLPASTINKGLLSLAQLEAIVYAGQAHGVTLPNGERKGFFIGDGTGVGKGREIAGIILDNERQGRKKALWVSASSGLIKDAKRDYSGVGGDGRRIFPQSKTKAANAIVQDDGVLFTTYDTLKGKERKQANDKGQGEAKTRLDQIINWLGKDFDGVIAFDESHSMGNAIARKGKRGTSKPALRALAGVNLQKALPKARIVYVSATGATEISNLSYAHRLGLWGEGSAFASVETFIQDVSRGGISSMELISRDMKAMGMYIARSLSYDGVTYDRLEHQLSPLQEDIYNELAGAWQGVLKNVHEALSITGGGHSTDAKKSAMAQFWGSQQRFFNQVITSMQTPSVIDDIQKQLDMGNVAVVQLVNTNEATQNREASKSVAEGTALEELDFTPRQMLIEYVTNSFPVLSYQAISDGDGGVTYEPVTNSKGEPVFNEDAIELRDNLLETLETIRVPENPIDSILNTFGSDIVAEVTGRKKRFLQTVDEQGNVTVSEEKRGKNSAQSDAQAFQDDKKKILIFSGAGGTGYSFHADNTAINQKKRIHYLLQPGWRADAAVQGFGRTHRTNQAQAPHYILPMTNLKAQKRFISSIARKLDQLGALTRGERKSTSHGMFSASDNLESQYAHDAMRNFFIDLHRGQTPLDFTSTTANLGLNLLDSDGHFKDSKIPEIPQFLNRLLSLKTNQQDEVFAEFESRIIEAVEYAKNNGSYDTGIVTLEAENIVKKSDEVVYTDKETGAETRYVELDVTEKINYLSAPKAKAAAKKSDRFDGFYTHSNGINKGQVFMLEVMGSRVNSAGQSIIRGIVTGINGQPRYIDNADQIKTGFKYGPVKVEGQNYSVEKKIEITKPINEKDALALWKEQVSSAPKTKTTTERMIVGVILPIWDRVEGMPQIFRLQTDSGEQLLGRMVSAKSAKTTLKNLGVKSDAAKQTDKEKLKSIVNGEKAILSNGWTISNSRVNNEKRIELISKSGNFTPAEQKLLVDQGAFMERISWRERFFIPQGKDGLAVFKRVTASKPVVDMVGKGDPLFSKAEKTTGSKVSLPHTAWHGSSSDFNEFDLSHFGEGEGGGAFGHGLHFSDDKDVAMEYATPDGKISIDGDIVYANESRYTPAKSILKKGYKAAIDDANKAIKANPDYPYPKKLLEVIKSLEKAIIKNQSSKGASYKVNLLPNENEYLLWDEPISYQSELVVNGIKDYMDELESYSDGGYLYNYISEEYFDGNDKDVSEELLSLGIKGVKYKNTLSHIGDKGAYNYTIFSAGDVQIIPKTKDSKKINQTLTSVNNVADSGSTVKEINRLLPKKIKNRDDVIVVQNKESVPESALDKNETYSDLDGVQALYDDTNNKIYLIADMLNAENLNAVLMHELYHFAEVNDAKLQAQLDNINKQFQRRFDLAAKGLGSKQEKAAYQRVMDADTPAKNQIKEFKAYLVEGYNNNPQSLGESIKRLIKNLYAAIRAALIRQGILPKNITPADLSALAQYGYKVDNKTRKVGSGTGRLSSVAPVTRSVDAVNKWLNGEPLSSGNNGVLGMAEESRVEKAARLFQDGFNRVKTLQKTIESRGGEVNDINNVYLAEELSSGITSARLKDLRKKYVESLIDAMRKKDITLKQLDSFVMAKHAEERNDYIDSINTSESMQGAGSGLSTKDANTILADFDQQGLTEKLDSLAGIVYDLNDQTLNMLVYDGIIDAETYHAYHDQYDNYVPLKGKEGVDNRGGTGQGYSVAGSGLKSAMGRGEGNLSESPVAHSIAQAENAIIRAEKARVGQTLIRLMKDNPDPDFWTVTKRNYNKFIGLDGELFEGFDSLPESLIDKQDVHRTMGITAKEKKQATLEKRKPKAQVVYKIDPAYKYRDDVFSVMAEGKLHQITIADTVMAEQLKKLNTNELNHVLKGMGSVNRFLAMVNTALNPEFVITNLERDLQSAGINLAGEHSGKVAAQVMRDVPKAINGIWLSVFNKSGAESNEWSKLYEELKHEGGTIGFFGLEDIESKVKSMEKELTYDGSYLGKTKAGLAKIKEVVLDANESVENAARLAAYKAARDKGFSKKQAASLAKNLTVNFNRRGEFAPVLNAAYLFANASIQGTARIFTALKHPKVRKIVKGIAATSFALAAYNMAAGGEDDDGVSHWEKLSDYTKQTNLIIMHPDGSGDYFKIKLPYGYNVFWYAGTAIHDLMRGKNTTVMGAAANMLTTVANAFNPIQGADFLDTITPTILKPVEQDYRNINFMMTPIRPENPFDRYDRPESDKSFLSTNQTLKEFAKIINEVTGGDDTQSGLIDISPETMKHYLGWVTGGAGMTAFRSAGTVGKVVTGETIKAKDVPFIRTLGGSTGTHYDTERFYSAVKNVRAAKSQVNIYRENRDDRLGKYIAKNRRVLSLDRRIAHYNKRIKLLRSRKNTSLRNGNYKRADQYKQNISQQMRNFLKYYDLAVG